MSKKVALLIGVSEYGEGIPSLSAPINDVEAMKQVLENPTMGGFDEIKTLINPDPTAMRLAVQRIFANCRKDDLVLLFFSGHGITDDNNRLFLATKGTSKDFYKATSVPASFIQDVSLESYAKRQAIVLDCCYSGAFAEGWQAKSVGFDLKKELGAEGRVVLTSSTATQTSFQQEGEELSLYTKYFVEGIETGAADGDGNGRIYAHELHDYAKAKVQEVKPKQKPGIIIDKEGFNILLSLAPVNDPELDFRRLVEKYATDGHITAAGNYILRVKRQELGIIDERCDEIVNEVLAPYRKRIENVKLYQEALIEAIEQNYPLTERLLKELQDLQDILGLEDKDIVQVQEQILAKKKAAYQLQQEIQQQEQEKYENKIAISKGKTGETLGVETLGGVMTAIIPKHTPLPVKRTEVFSTAVDGQNNVEINVLKGNHELAKDNVSLGTFRVNEIPPAPRGVPQIEVTFAIDETGILSVSARDKGTGNKASVTIQKERNTYQTEVTNQNESRQKELDESSIPLESRSDYDLVMSLSLTSEEMNQGLQKEIDLKDGKKITVKIPAGVKNGQKIRVRGKGQIDTHNQKRGDLYLIIRGDESEKNTAQNKIDVIKGWFSKAKTGETLGVETWGGVMTAIIPKHTSLPVKRTEVFSTALDGQNNVEINVLKGNHELAKDNVSLGTFRVNEIPPAPKGVPQIEVTFAIDETGILSVSARDQGTGNEASVTIQEPQSPIL